MAAGDVTADLAGWIAAGDDVPSARARRAATQVVLDWVGVTLAGAGAADTGVLARDAAASDGPGPVPIVGRDERLSGAAAARVMGMASHLLDFDDINKRMRGHPSVTILPALLAAGPDRSGADVVSALIAGTEVACCLGEMMGETHYLRGYHTTATVGSVAAAAAVARLLQLDRDRTRSALCLAATRSAGLRALFGTAAKPLHAGLAAQNGLEAVRWAMAGLTVDRDGIGAAHGLGPVLSDGYAPQPIRQDRTAPFGIEQNIFKFHAACYYTHSAIEAALALRARGLAPEGVARIEIGLQKPLHGVCDIVAPQTGLEVKFSVRHLVAMALLGRATSDPAAFTKELAHDAEVVALRDRAEVVPLATDNRMLAELRIDDQRGGTYRERMDVSTPADDLDRQERVLMDKFTQLALPVLGVAARDIGPRILGMDGPRPITDLLNDLTTETG